jgi:hypothetical protein
MNKIKTITAIKRDLTGTRWKIWTSTVRSYEQADSIGLRVYNVYDFLQTFSRKHRVVLYIFNDMVYSATVHQCSQKQFWTVE